MQTTFKNALKAGTIAAVLVLGTAAAHADTMNFVGSTTGVFTQNGTTTDKTLTFNSGNFDVTTSTNGFVSVGTTSTTNSFGTFRLTNGTADYTNDPFQLTILFTNPTGINGGQNSTFSATVIGSVTRGSGGGVNVSFSPSTQSYTFANGVQSGSFTLNLNNVAITNGSTSAVTGFIQSTTVAATPEPNSLMLLGTGFVSAAGMLMRRRKTMTA